MRQVFGEIGAGKVSELVVINKADAADPLVLQRLCRLEPAAVIVSARTGRGLDELRAAVERAIPRPPVVVDVVLPYDRGDLVSRVHQVGEVLEEQHTEAGTRLRARVFETLAAELTPYATTRA